MWKYDIDYQSWSMKNDKLDLIQFEYFKQELDSYRLYSKCFSGASFITSNNTDNIYEILTYDIPKNWYIDDSVGVSGSHMINGTSSYEYYTKYNSEYGGSLKNLFTPERAIKEFMNNYFYVDVATTAKLNDLHDEVINRKIDGIRLKEGHKVLIKDQTGYTYSSINDFDFDVFPTGFTNSNGEFEYMYYTEENGLYTYEDNKLIKDTEFLSIYENCIRYSIACKLGDNNFDKQFHLKRLKTGYFPLDDSNTPLQFVQRTNRLLRNQVDYHNLYDIPYYDILHHGAQLLEKDGVTYSIPERTIAIGEFGIIVNNQYSISNTIRNKYKIDLKSLIETNEYYWAVGDENIILRIDKITFDVKKINVDAPFEVSLKSIDFFNNLKGITVGTDNTIFITDDGGVKWEQIIIESFDAFNYNKVLYKNNYTFYIVGDNGVFIEFKYINGDWEPFKKRISKFIDEDDEFLMLDDINDLILFETSGWSLTSSYTSNISTDKDLLLMVTDDNNFIIYDCNNSIPYHTKFFYLEFPHYYSDIKTVIKDTTSDVFYFTGYDPINGESGIFSFHINYFDNLGIGNSYSNVCQSIIDATYESDSYPNAMYSYNGVMYIAGNNSMLDHTSYYILLIDDNSNIITPDITGGEGGIIIGSSFSFTPIDEDYDDRLRPRFLFLDYDVAEKLNFFTKDGDYILPNSVDILVGTSSNDYVFLDSLTFSNITGRTYKEINWWSYWKDSLSTFEYFSNTDLIKIEISSTFSYSASYSNVTIQGSTSSNNLSEIINLAPNIESSTASRYDGTAGGINTLVVNSDLYLYNYIMIFNIDNYTFSCDVGDILNFEVTYMGELFLHENFLVNKIEGGYAYMYTNFNENIINNIASTYSSIKIMNLNKYEDVEDFCDKFNKHPISNGYMAEKTELSGSVLDYDNILLIDNDDNIITPDISGGEGGIIVGSFSFAPIVSNVNISTRFNNLTSYYNMGTEVHTNVSFDEMVYKNSFLWFGYKPTYNILDYLEFLNHDKFYPTKEYYSMPQYNKGVEQSKYLYNTDPDNVFIYVDMGIAPGASHSNTEIYYETPNYHLNKIYFGENLKFEWNAYFKNTFIDIETDNNIGNDRLFILDKYEIEIEDPISNNINKYYVIEFDRSVTKQTSPSNIPSTIDILSRRKLQEISEDLELITNIQRPWVVKDFEFGSLSATFSTLEKDLNFKINTDNYSKIMLSDIDTFKELSMIFYNDYKNDVVFNVTQLEEEYLFEINNLTYSTNSLSIEIDSTKYINKYNGLLLLPSDGYTASSSYFGYHVVTDVINNQEIEISNIIHDPLITKDDIIVKIIKRDPFLNYQPIDTYDIGMDKMTNIATELYPENTILNGREYSLINVDYNNHRFRLIDGLDILQLAINYSWIYEAEISNAIIGVDDNGLVWYSGSWKCGRWFGGTWISGIWISGDWYNGIWKSKHIKDHFTHIEIDNLHSNRYKSMWYDGRWFNGKWENGTWRKGRWYDGEWKNGAWYDGIWNDGMWRDGDFTGGVWVLGEWDAGNFLAKNAPAYWLDGRFKSGDFENGRWYNGTFGSNDKNSRFGIRAHNSRKAIWMSGNWINGSFHSRINLDDDNNYAVSDIHSYSVWYNGNWNNGDFYGGIAYNMTFRSGTWYGGILEELNVIEIIGTQSSDKNTGYFITDSPAIFNIGYEFYIIDNNQGLSYSNDYGSNQSPHKYKVLYSIEEPLYGGVRIYVKDIGATSSGVITGNLKIVSDFKYCNWKSGIWTNGIYENGLWEGGIWYNGNFHANWN